MQNDDLKTNAGRREFVKMAAGGAVALPLTGLIGCSGGDDSAAKKAEQAAASAADSADKAAEAATEMADSAADSMDAMADQAGEMADDAKQAAADMASDAEQAAGEMVDGAKTAADSAAGSLPKLEESDPVAQALGYKHDASDVNQDKYPGRGATANEYCKSCALYVAGDNGWGACSIFAGKAVNANGWCASYNRKSA